ncbi:mucin-2-like [Coregonus clupeaformis]|uniref:mucin-2-like n=1 Tax=Coregonus clupeaformis TaxID=59861 RepID=UPI001E1C4CA1|nr:mucin-2-like [Coregonus clupeaformis]
MGWTTLWLCVLALPLTSAVQVKAKKARQSNHVNSICSTWGREHFKTFDGDVYQFPGTCEYNLASDCHSESYQEFSVHLKRNEATEDEGNPTVKHVVVTINDLVFHLTKTLVTVNGEIVTLPYYNGGVQLERNAVYTKLYSKVGLVVMWNGEDAVMVELDSEYTNRTCGLCGDFNGLPVHNEFIYNGRKVGPVEFGNMQKVHRPNEDCEDPYEEEDEPADVQPREDTCKEFHAQCDQLLRSALWSSCGAVVNPEPYIQACVQDLCGCSNTSDSFCVCSTLAEYSRQCSHAGGQPPHWRTTAFCDKQCPFNMVYLESGSPCLDTCTHSDTSSLCEEHLMDGCFCPHGTVFDDISKRGCISQDQCQCKHDKVYNSGEVFRQDREECVCHHGQWSCKSLPSPATCAVEEGSHVTTFDGKAYTFHGDCYYPLAKVESKDEASPKFTVLGQLVPCIRQKFDTCLKSVVVLLNNDRNNALVISADGKVSHNAQITLPYNTADISVFQPSSFHMILQTSFGLQVQIQLIPIMQVYVTLDESYKTKTQGLCGNFNKVLSDDMKTPQGMVEGTASSFGNSWKANPTCRDREERLDDPCSLSVENENYAKHWCSLLRSSDSTFAKCHAMVDPEIYYKRCTYASCNCEKSEDCLCAVFSSYVRDCATKGVVLSGWRENVCDKYTGNCPASQTYSDQVQRCQLTCSSLASKRQGCTNDFLPVDGCSCPDGLYMDDRGTCVPMAKCPCFHNGVHIKPGKSINIQEEHCVCTNGKLHCRSWKMRSESTCQSPKVFLNCSNDLGVQCTRSCRNPDFTDCFSAECESGCKCPMSLWEDGKGMCVKKHECPCSHDGALYAPGKQIPNGCNTCTCKSGKWECTDKKCPGSCTIYGSGHYKTFDERTYGFQGKCGYVAVQNKCGNRSGHDNFTVITENIPCGTTGTTCSKSVRVQLGRTELKLSKGTYEVVNLGVGSQIQYRVRSAGLYLIVESDIGIAVLWDRKTTVRIILEPQHSGAVCGLCGDFNGDGRDDFTTQGQMVVSSPVEFANSWKVSSTCPDAESNVDPCGARPDRHNWAKMQCSIIRGKTFELCHKKVDPAPFFENCVKDSCACDTGGDCECFCTAVAAYAQACTEAGVCVAWRTPEICPVFCDYYNDPGECEWHYSPCHTPCFKTCLNPNGTCSNPIPNLEGCYPRCPPRMPIFDEETGECVEICDEIPPPPTTTTPIPSTTTSIPPTTTPRPPPPTTTTTTPPPPTTTTTTPMPPTTTTTTIPTTTTPIPPPTTTTTTTPIPPTTTTTPTPPTTTPIPPTTTTPIPPTTTTTPTPPTTTPIPPPTTTTPIPPTTTTTPIPPTTTTTPTPPTTTPIPPTTTRPRPPPTTTTPTPPTTTTTPIPPTTTTPTPPTTTTTPIPPTTTPIPPPTATTTPTPTTTPIPPTTTTPIPPTTTTTPIPPTTSPTPPTTTTTPIPPTTTTSPIPPTTTTTPIPPTTTTPIPPTTTTPIPPTTTPITPTTTTTPIPTTTTTPIPPTTTTPIPPTTTTPIPPTTTTPIPPTTTTPIPPTTTTTTPIPPTTTTPIPPTTTTPIPPTTTTTTTTTPIPPPTTTTTPIPPTTTTPIPPTTTTPIPPTTTTTPIPPPTTTTTTTPIPPTTTTPIPPTTTTTPVPPTTTTPIPPTTTTTPTPPTTTTTPIPPTTTTPIPPTTTTPKPPTTTTPIPPPTTTTTTTPTTTPIPTTTSPQTTEPPTTPCIPTCEWSEWYDEDDDKDKSDWETYWNITQSGKQVCEDPQDIECVATDYPNTSLEDFVAETGQVVECNVDFGLICEQNKQTQRPFKCKNYKIRVLCCVICISTTKPPTTTPTTTEISTSEKPTTTPRTTEEPTTTPRTTEEPTTTPRTTEEPTTTPPVTVTTTTKAPTTTHKPTTTTEATTLPTTPRTTEEPNTTPRTTEEPTTTPPVTVTTTTKAPTTTHKPTTTTEATTLPTTPRTTEEPTTTPRTTEEQTTTPPETITTTTKAPTTTPKPSTTTEATTLPTTPRTTEEPTTTPRTTEEPTTTPRTTEEPTTTPRTTEEPTTTPRTTEEPTTTPPVTVTTTTKAPTTTPKPSTTTEATTLPTTPRTTEEPTTTPRTTEEPTTTPRTTEEPTTTPPVTVTTTTKAPTTTPKPSTTTEATTLPTTPRTTEEPTTTPRTTEEPTTTPRTTEEPTTTPPFTKPQLYPQPPGQLKNQPQPPGQLKNQPQPPGQLKNQPQPPGQLKNQPQPPGQLKNQPQPQGQLKNQPQPPVQLKNQPQPLLSQSPQPLKLLQQHLNHQLPQKPQLYPQPPGQLKNQPQLPGQLKNQPQPLLSQSPQPLMLLQQHLNHQLPQKPQLYPQPQQSPPGQLKNQPQPPGQLKNQPQPPGQLKNQPQPPGQLKNQPQPPGQLKNQPQPPYEEPTTTPPVTVTTTTKAPTTTPKPSTTTEATTLPTTPRTTEEPTTTPRTTEEPTTTPPVTVTTTTNAPTTTPKPSTTTEATTLPTTPSTTEEPTTTPRTTEEPTTTPPVTVTTTTKAPTTTPKPSTTTEATTLPTTPRTSEEPTTTPRTTEEPTTTPRTTEEPTTTPRTTEEPTTTPRTTEKPTTTTPVTVTTTTNAPTTTSKPSTTTEATTLMTTTSATTHESVVTGPTLAPPTTESQVGPTPTTTGTPTPPPITCPEWDKVQNETFWLCNCTLARCIENNTIEIIPYECPEPEPITCANGKKPVLQWDEFYCCQRFVCDCVCEGWGDPHYITFDGLFYSFQGNCTYVLMEEMKPRHNFKIYIDNVNCDPTEDVSCPRAIIVSYRSTVITLKNHNLIGAAQLEALIDGVSLRLPFKRNGVKVMTSGINMVLEIAHLQVVVTFGVTGFSVNLPWQHFGNNTQGHCGTCNNNQADDCMLPGGQLVENCAVMADYWPAQDLYQPDCPVPPGIPTNSPLPEPTQKPCKPDSSVCDLLKDSVFAACHPFVSPDNFYQGCVYDSCHVSNPAVECTSLQAYAAACAQFGVCIYWRNHTTLCASDCPVDKVYKPCGPAEQPTCDDNPDESRMNVTTEGCFCPDGMKLFNKDSGICVDKCGCIDPEGVPREFNERFEYKCQDCVCMESTKIVTCEPKVCSKPPVEICTGPGFVYVNQTDPSDPCCSSLVCRCDSSTCQPTNMNCPIGFLPVVSVPEGKCCAEHTCEPKRVCLHKGLEYQPNSKVPGSECQECTCTNKVDPKTGHYQIDCGFVQCDEDCEKGYEYQEPDYSSDDCCGKCVQTHCVLQINGTKQLLKHGDTWSAPGDKCQQYSCMKNGDSYLTQSSYIHCPPFQQANCQPGSIQTAANGCCKICVEKDKACKIGSMKTVINHKGCQSIEKVEMPYCEGSCNTFTKYSAMAASLDHSCTCCQESRASNRTVELQCLNGDVVPYTYLHVEECGCRHNDCHRAIRVPARKGRSYTLV